MTVSRAPRRVRPAALTVLAALALVSAAGCGAGDEKTTGADAAAPTTTASSPTADEATAEDPGEDVDPEGAEDVAERVGELLDAARATFDSVTRDLSAAEIQATVRTLRNDAFEADADLREIDVADVDLQAAVGSLLGTISESIGVFDSTTTAAAAELGADEAAKLVEAEIALMAGAATLQEAAAFVAAGLPVPGGATLAEVLPVADDFPVVSGVRDPAYQFLPEGTPPGADAAEGPCGDPSPMKAVPPASYVGMLADDPAVVGSARVLAYTGESDASAYVDALAASYSCDEPTYTESAEVDHEDGETAVLVLVSDGITTTIQAERVGTRVLVAVRTGDQISDAGDAAGITGDQAEGLIEVMKEKAEA